MSKIAIVGAGPVGLTTALLLASMGHECFVLERRSKPEWDGNPLGLIYQGGSRAVVTQRSSLQIWDRVDPTISKTLLGLGLVWKTKEIWRGKKKLFSTEYQSEAEDGLPPFLNVPQPTVEAALLESAKRFSHLIHIHWSHKVDGVVDVGKYISVNGTRQGKPFSYSAQWLVGADGTGSAVRKSIGVQMPRTSSRKWYIIADVHDTDGRFPFDSTARQYYYSYPDRSPQSQLLAMPQPGGVWRLDWPHQFPLSLSSDPQMSVSRHVYPGSPIFNYMQRILGADVRYDMLSLSQYQFRSSVADRFVGDNTIASGPRIILAGNAAHDLPPFGGRGMNSGIEDAWGAADAIDYAIHNSHSSALFQYADLARSKAVRNVGAAQQVLRVLEAHSTADRTKRRLALATASWSRKAQRYLDTGPYRPDSAVSTTTKGGAR